MTETNFISKNEEQWKALDAFNRRIKGKIRNISTTEVKEFAHLFRLASHHLAYAKTHFPTSHVVPYLNKVVGASHNYFYVRERRALSDVRRYFTHTFPRAVCETWRFSALATVLFAMGLVFAWVYVAADLHRLQEVVPAFFAGGFSPYEVPDWGDGGIDVEHSLMAATITTNNLMVTFNAIGGGLLAGIGTVFIMIYNGLIIGGLFGFFHTVGANMVIAYALVLPHGVIELLAIFLAGGCGLMLAKGMLLPGEMTLRQSLISQGKNVAKLLPGIAAMLVIAGIIEGYFTPLAIDARIKIVFAGLTGVVMVAYFLLGRREARKNA